jgi:GT2 family glycosyltransferase
MPVHVVVARLRGPDPEAAGATDASLAAQTDARWTTVDVAAEDRTRTDGLRRLPIDIPLPDDAGTTLLLVLADGETLHPEAVATVAARAEAGARLVTFDSVRPDGSRHVRPGWSPEVLLSTDYLGAGVAVELGLLDAARSRLAADDPWCTWTALLAVDPTGLVPEQTAHVARDLVTEPPRPVPDDVRLAVVAAGLRARGWPATPRLAVDGDPAGGIRLDWHLDAWPSVTLVIPSRHNVALLEPCLTSLTTTTGPTFDVLLVDNGERTPEAEAWYDRDWGFPLRVRWWTEPFNYSTVNNVAVREATGEVVVLVNDDTVVRDPGWLAELVGLATRPGVGCVGMQLLDAEGRVQHAGVWVGLGGFAGHLFAGMQPGDAGGSDDGLFGSSAWYRNTLAVTGACLAVRRETYLAVDGLADEMVLCGSDVVLGLDLYARGLRNVSSPLPGLLHLESATRSSAPVGDQLVSLERYKHFHDHGDPYFSERLSLRSRVPTLRRDDEVSPVDEARERLGVRA